MFKKAIIVFLITFFALSAAMPIKTVSAAAEGPDDQGQWWNPTFQDFNRKVHGTAPDQVFGERYTYAQVVWIMYSLISAPVGKDIMQCLSGGADNIVTCIQGITSDGSINNSPILGLYSFIDVMKNTRPASGVDWMANVGNNLHIIPEAKAQSQGFGFNTLTLAQNLWKASRNAAYALTTLAIVVLAFSIMFRVKISPQASVTIQTAIPKVAIGLVLITFSYALAGLIVDLSYLLQGLVALIIAGTTNGITQMSPIEMFIKMNDGAGSFFSYAFSLIVIAFTSGSIFGQITIIPGPPPAGIGIPTGATFGLFIAIISIVMLIVAALTVFWTLLKAYVTAIFQVVGAPFYILMGIASPTMGFGSWFKSFIANIATFPLVGIMILFAHILLWGSIDGSVASGWTQFNVFKINSNFIADAGTAQLPTFSNTFSPGAIGYFSSLVLMLAIPSVCKTVKSLIETGKAGRFEGLAGMGIAGSVIGGAAGGATSLVGNKIASKWGGTFGPTATPTGAARIAQFGYQQIFGRSKPQMDQMRKGGIGESIQDATKKMGR